MSSDYNPGDFRQPEVANTAPFTVLLHLLKACIGSGILFTPYGFMKAGWLASLVIAILVGLITMRTSVTTVVCSQVLCRRARVPSLDYANTCEYSFKLGPESLRKYAGAFAMTTNSIVCFVQYSTAVIYMLYVAGSFHQVMEHYFKWDMEVRIYILALFPICCLMSLVPNYQWLMPFSVIGWIFMASGITATFYYLLRDLPDPSRMATHKEAETMPYFATIFLYAVHLMSVLMPLENSLKNPKSMPFLTAVAILFAMALNIVFGILGYNKYLDNTCDSIIKNLPLEDTLAQVVKIVVALAVLFTYGLQYSVPITILWPMIGAKVGDNFLYEGMFRLFGVTVTTLLALAVPHMVPLLGLLMALSMTTSMLLVPSLIEIATYWEESQGFGRFYLTAKTVLTVILWIGFLISGSISSIEAIIKAFDSSNADTMCLD